MEIKLSRRPLLSVEAFGVLPRTPEILFGRFQVKVRNEEFVGLFLRCMEWESGGAQTSENGL